MAAIVRAFVLLAVVALASAVSAAPVGIDLGGLRLQDSTVKEARYSYCEWMRRGCIYREAWGEIGETSCRRYHTDCLGRTSYCEWLRRGCIYKHAWDQVGQGNCRRYRAHCGGGMSYCQQLRHACIYGEYGEGNCRRYVRECR